MPPRRQAMAANGSESVQRDCTERCTAWSTAKVSTLSSDLTKAQVGPVYRNRDVHLPAVCRAPILHSLRAFKQEGLLAAVYTAGDELLL